MTVPVVRIHPITLESSENDTLVERIKGHFDQKAFTLCEKSGYDFSNLTRLGELKDEVTDGKTHSLIVLQMKFRKQGYYIVTPKFGLGFKLLEPLQISTRKVKETTSSYHISLEGEKKGEYKKTPQWTSLFNHIGKSIPCVSVFDRFRGKDGSGAYDRVEGDVTASNFFVSLYLGTTKNPSSRKRLLEHEQ
ncbi:hypothetical protein BC332_28095 [Capsicum chinense]|nr:hypothetical protein BC332_28095 [Capsicum chinense]